MKTLTYMNIFVYFLLVSYSFAYSTPSHPTPDYSSENSNLDHFPLEVDEFVVPQDTVSSGGETSIDTSGIRSFNRPAANIRNTPIKDETLSHDLLFLSGNGLFTGEWVEAGASTHGRDGLGPLFNARSCESCHVHDGKGVAPRGEKLSNLGLLLRLGIPLENGSIPDPNYGNQLQDLSILGIEAEAQVTVSWKFFDEKYPDGTPYRLKKPVFGLSHLKYGPLDSKTKWSPRLAPMMIGLGLLENIPLETLQALEKQQAKRSDGISGRIHYLNHDQSLIGRFGWKAETPSVMAQNLAAAAGDLGITSHLVSNDSCTQSQVACRKARNGGEPELTDKQASRLETYAKLLAVPKRRQSENMEIQQGEHLFYKIGCHLCHATNLKTGQDPNFPELSNQLIHPYTDLLLHDMGPELADQVGFNQARPEEWRTAPLWGIGLVKEINDRTGFLHDGRANTIEEAILWHGGEAEGPKQAFKHLSLSQRKALLKFLDHL